MLFQMHSLGKKLHLFLFYFHLSGFRSDVSLFSISLFFLWIITRLWQFVIKNHTKVLLRKYQEPPFLDDASYITLTQKPTPQGLWIKWVLWPVNDSNSTTISHSHHKHLHEDDTRFSCHASVHYAESRLSTARPHPLSLTHKYKCVHQGGLQCSSHQRQR